MNAQRPNELSAAQAAAAIRAGSLRSIELVEACLERIAAREHEVGAWQCIDVEQAREQALRCDSETPRGRVAWRAVRRKDIIETADCRPNTDRRSTAVADRAGCHCVALTRRAGAILLGKTVTTEFASLHPGKTRNPQDLPRTPGGSSSGSAAAVPSDGPVAFGTQTGRVDHPPASYCGVVGYKPRSATCGLAGVQAVRSVARHARHG